MDSAPTPIDVTPATVATTLTSEPTVLPPPRKKPKPFYARTRGARKGRMEKIEDLLHPLIKVGRVKVIRRKFAPPLIQWVPEKPQPQAQTEQ